MWADYQEALIMLLQMFLHIFVLEDILPAYILAVSCVTFGLLRAGKEREAEDYMASSILFAKTSFQQSVTTWDWSRFFPGDESKAKLPNAQSSPSCILLLLKQGSRWWDKLEPLKALTTAFLSLHRMWVERGPNVEWKPEVPLQANPFFCTLLFEWSLSQDFVLPAENIEAK